MNCGHFFIIRSLAGAGALTAPGVLMVSSYSCLHFLILLQFPFLVVMDCCLRHRLSGVFSNQCFQSACCILPWWVQHSSRLFLLRDSFNQVFVNVQSGDVSKSHNLYWCPVCVSSLSQLAFCHPVCVGEIKPLQCVSISWVGTECGGCFKIDQNQRGMELRKRTPSIASVVYECAL